MIVNPGTFCSVVRWFLLEDQVVNSPRRCFPVIVLIGLFLGMQGCSSTALRDAVNASFPPVNPVDHQVAAVKDSAAALAAFAEQPTFYAAISAGDLGKLLGPSLTASIKSSPGEEILVEATSVHVALGPQEVIARAKFTIELPAEETRVKGAVEVHCAAGVELGALVLRPSASSLRLSSVVYRGKQSTEVLRPVVNALLRRFLDNVNGAIASVSLPLRFHAIRALDLAKELKSAPGITESAGPVIQGGVALGSSAVLIEPSALRVLASAVFLTPEVFEKSFEVLQARVKANSSKPWSSLELAALAACEDPLKLAAGVHASEPAQVAAICEAAKSSLSHIKTEPYPTKSEAYAALAASYPGYHAGFLKKAQEVEPGNRVFDSDSMIAISRSAVSAGLQQVLAPVSASAEYRAAIPAQPFNELITPSTTDLNCTENAGHCESHFTYSPYQPRGCDSDCNVRKCGFWGCWDFPDLGCVARKLECEATKERERLEYEAGKAAAHLRWMAEKAACELRKEINKKGCEINQGWLDAWASKEIARVQGTATVSSLRARASIAGFRVDPDLASVSLQCGLAADAAVRAEAKVIPLNGGHLICVMPADIAVDASASVPETSRTVSAARAPVLRDGDDLALTYEVPSQALQLKFSPPLAVALYQQNRGKLLLSCPAPSALVAGLTGFAGGLVGLEAAMALKPDLFDSKQTVEIPSFKLPLRIPPVVLAVPRADGSQASSVRLRPEWGKNAIIFSAEVGR